MKAAQIVSLLLDSDPAVDPKDYVMRLPGEVPMDSAIKPGDDFTAPLRIVLKPSHREGEWVTRVQNMQTGGEDTGHYFDSYKEAFKDYVERCQRLGVID